MPNLHFVVLMFWVGLMVFGAGAAAQNYPNKIIRIFTGPAAGGNDLTARLIAQTVTGPLGQPVIVENRGLFIAIEAVAKAPPDGYSVLLVANTLWNLPLMKDSILWDALRDFTPITLVAIMPNVLAVHPSLPVKSVKELIALAKARPGDLNYANTGLGSATHLAAELFKSMAGVNIVTITYRGGAGAVSALVSGEVQLAFNSASTVGPHVKSGRLRPLAVTSAQPSMLAPGLPTIAASGLPGYESVTLPGTFVPSRTPAAIVARLNQEFVRALNREEVKVRLLSAGVESVGNSPEQVLAMIKSDMATVSKLVKDVGISSD